MAQIIGNMPREGGSTGFDAQGYNKDAPHLVSRKEELAAARALRSQMVESIDTADLSREELAAISGNTGAVTDEIPTIVSQRLDTAEVSSEELEQAISGRQNAVDENQDHGKSGSFETVDSGPEWIRGDGSGWIPSPDWIVEGNRVLGGPTTIEIGGVEYSLLDENGDINLLGKGGVGSVYEVTPIEPSDELPESRVLKLMPSTYEDGADRFASDRVRAIYEANMNDIEGNLAGSKMITVDADQVIHALLLEKGGGMDLMRFFRENGRWVNSTEGQAVAVQGMNDVLQRLESFSIHGWIHRDVKPENILASKNPEDWQLIDHGIAREGLVREQGSTDEEAGDENLTDEERTRLRATRARLDALSAAGRSPREIRKKRKSIHPGELIQDPDETMDETIEGTLPYMPEESVLNIESDLRDRDLYGFGTALGISLLAIRPDNSELSPINIYFRSRADQHIDTFKTVDELGGPEEELQERLQHKYELPGVRKAAKLALDIARVNDKGSERRQYWNDNVITFDTTVFKMKEAAKEAKVGMRAKHLYEGTAPDGQEVEEVSFDLFERLMDLWPRYIRAESPKEEIQAYKELQLFFEDVDDAKKGDGTQEVA